MANSGTGKSDVKPEVLPAGSISTESGGHEPGTEERLASGSDTRGAAPASHGDGVDQALPTGHDPEKLHVDAPPEGLRIDAAQVGGSSRGGEWNTAPHPGSPTSDRQAEKQAAPAKRRPASSDKKDTTTEEGTGDGAQAKAQGRKPGR